MSIMIGDNRLENAALRTSDARTKEIQQDEQQVLQREADEKARKAAGDGVVLEISKTDVDNSKLKSEEISAVDKIAAQKEELEEKTRETQRAENERMMAAQRQTLENIDIF